MLCWSVLLGLTGLEGADRDTHFGFSSCCLKILDSIAGRSPARSHLPHLDLRPGHPVALLVNGLGATTAMELHVAARAALAHARESLEVEALKCLGDSIEKGLHACCRILVMLASHCRAGQRC